MKGEKELIFFSLNNFSMLRYIVTNIYTIAAISARPTPIKIRLKAMP